MLLGIPDGSSLCLAMVLRLCIGDVLDLELEVGVPLGVAGGLVYFWNRIFHYVLLMLWSLAWKEARGLVITIYLLLMWMCNASLVLMEFASTKVCC